MESASQGKNEGGGSRGAVGREVALTFVGVCVATVAITRLSPDFTEYVHVLVAGLFLLVSVKLAQRAGGLARFGIALDGLLEPPEDTDAGPLGLKELGRTLQRAVPSGLRETLVALLVAAVVFPPFVLGFYFWHLPDHPFVLRPPDDLFTFVIAQLVIVGVPEEALFRGYFQTRLTDIWPARTRVLGALLSPKAFVLQAILFAALHFAVDLQPARLAVFFPALLFGWMRAWRGGIGAAVVLHALSNVLSEVLVRGWL